jgi:transcriptional regulator with XRE-family HTH domain
MSQVCAKLMHMNNFRAWLTTRTSGTGRSIAERAGLDPSTLSRQLSKDKPSAQTIVAICRAFDLPLLEGFVAAGFITDEEADYAGQQAHLGAVPSVLLAEELSRRAKTGTLY